MESLSPNLQPKTQHQNELTKLKQNYLKKNIIEAGFDGEDFAEYLEKIKENGKI